MKVPTSIFYLGVAQTGKAIRVGEQRPIEIVAVTPDERPYEQAFDAEVTLEKLVWNSVKTQGAGGVITVQNHPATIFLHSEVVQFQPGQAPPSYLFNL